MEHLLYILVMQAAHSSSCDIPLLLLTQSSTHQKLYQPLLSSNSFSTCSRCGCAAMAPAPVQVKAPVAAANTTASLSARGLASSRSRPPASSSCKQAADEGTGVRLTWRMQGALAVHDAGESCRGTHSSRPGDPEFPCVFPAHMTVHHHLDLDPRMCKANF